MVDSADAGGRSHASPARTDVFTRMFEAHWAAVRRHIECYLDDDLEVTEVVGEVFVVAWARLNPSRPMGRVWLIRTADRRLRARRASTRTPARARDSVALALSGERDLSAGPARADVHRALAALTPRERRVLVLTYWDGLTVSEVAELTRTSESRVRARIHGAWDRLRAELGADGGDVG